VNAVMNFGFHKMLGNYRMAATLMAFRVVLNSRQLVNCTISLLGRCLRLSFRMPSIPQAFLSFKEYINFCKSRGLFFQWDCCLQLRRELVASTRRSLSLSHSKCGVNWFSKQSAIALAFSSGCNVRSKGPCITVGALGLSLFMRDFTIGHIA
jgi:hypothetical protein